MNGICFGSILTEIKGNHSVHYTDKDVIDEPFQLEEVQICNGMIAFKVINEKMLLTYGIGCNGWTCFNLEEQ